MLAGVASLSLLDNPSAVAELLALLSQRRLMHEDFMDLMGREEFLAWQIPGLVFFFL